MIGNLKTAGKFEFGRKTEDGEEMVMVSFGSMS